MKPENLPLAENIHLLDLTADFGFQNKRQNISCKRRQNLIYWVGQLKKEKLFFFLIISRFLLFPETRLKLG